MKLNPWYFLAAGPILLLAYDKAFAAQVAVLGATLGIFFGTVTLRRPTVRDATSTGTGH